MVFELTGAIFGTLRFGEGLATYGFGLLGAAIGALFSVFIAKGVSIMDQSDQDMIDSDVI